MPVDLNYAKAITPMALTYSKFRISWVNLYKVNYNSISAHFYT
jgi:hypothetical protein